MMGEPEDLYLLATDAGYGFVCRLGDLQTRNKAGKTVITIPKAIKVLPPVKVRDPVSEWILAVTSAGYLLVISLNELPQLNRGKGNKIINIPSAKLKAREEFLVALELLREDENLTLFCGKRHRTMRNAEVREYVGERGRRGRKLPRGYQKVDGVRIDKKNHEGTDRRH